MTWNEIWAAIGQVILAGGGGAVVAFALFQFLGQKWVESKFEKDLETYKAAQARELEQYKSRVLALFNRVSKIHEKEFEVIVEAWHRLQYAMGTTKRIAGFHQEFPDLRFMTSEGWDDFLCQLNWKTSDIQDLRLAEINKRNETYQRIVFWYNLDDSIKAAATFHNFLLDNKIFLNQDLFEGFRKIDTSLMDVMNTMRTGKLSADENFYRQGYVKFHEFSQSEQLANLESLIQQRLHSHSADEFLEG